MATPETNERKAAATKRSTAAKKAAGTRAQNQTRKAARTQARRTTRSAQRTATRATATAEREVTQDANQVQDLFERAALTYVGAALTASDRVAQGYDYLRKTYGDTDSVTRQLKKFERRGTRARKDIEREVKKARTRLERTLRQNRRRAERQVTTYRKDARLASARVENVVQTGVAAGAGVAQKVTERVASVA